MVAALGLPALAAGLAARMDRDLLGPDLDSEPPQTRAAVRRVARGLVDGARHVWHAPAGRARAGRDRRAPVLLRRLDHHRRSCCSALLQRPGRRRRRARRAGDGVRGVRRRLLPRGRRHARGRPSGCASRPGSSICFALAAVVRGGLRRGAQRVAAARRRLRARASRRRARRSASTRSCRSSVDDAFRGRVFSFYDVIFNIAFVSAAAFGAVALPDRRQLARGLRRRRRRVRRDRGRLRPRHQAPHRPHRSRRSRAVDHVSVDPRSLRKAYAPAQRASRPRYTWSTAGGSAGRLAAGWPTSGAARPRPSSRAAGPARAAPPSGAARPCPTSGPGGTPRISMIALPSRSGRIDVQLLLLAQPGDPLLEVVVGAAQRLGLAPVAGRAVRPGQLVQPVEQRARRRRRSGARRSRSTRRCRSRGSAGAARPAGTRRR